MLSSFAWLDQSPRIPPFDEVEGSGWEPIVVSLFEEIDRVIGSTGTTFELLQLKEKLGKLRLYYRLRDASPAQEEKIAQLYKASVEASGRTCFQCGTRAELRWLEGWLIAVCEEHRDTIRGHVETLYDGRRHYKSVP